MKHDDEFVAVTHLGAALALIDGGHEFPEETVQLRALDVTVPWEKNRKEESHYKNHLITCLEFCNIILLWPTLVLTTSF